MRIEKRITPESSALLHGTRHAGYQSAEDWRKAALRATDEEILDFLENSEKIDSVYMARRTPYRVRLRMYAQEASRRGIYRGGEK